MIVSREKLGDEYAQNAGYLATAEANNIIVVFPQIKSNPYNPYGCWDFYGYSGQNYGRFYWILKLEETQGA